MDAGHFPTYEKIINTTPLPRTRQERGLFLIELAFDPQATTASRAADMTLEFSAFGSVTKVLLDRWSEAGAGIDADALRSRLAEILPPVSLAVNAALDRLELTVMINPARRTKRVRGTLVVGTNGSLTALLAPV